MKKDYLFIFQNLFSTIGKLQKRPIRGQEVIGGRSEESSRN